MSTQGTVSRVLPGTGGTYGQGSYALGSSDDTQLADSYQNTKGDFDITAITANFQAVLDGNQTSNSDFGTINMDYGHTDAPTLDENTVITDTDGKTSGKKDTACQANSGMPAGPFVPTTASPSDGSVNATAQPAVKPVGGGGQTNGKTTIATTDRANYQIPVVSTS